MPALPPELAAQALCRDSDNGWPWITPESTTKQEFEVADALAKEICGRCPVRQPCRVAGLKEPRGTWGGVNYRERGF